MPQGESIMIFRPELLTYSLFPMVSRRLNKEDDKNGSMVKENRVDMPGAGKPGFGGMRNDAVAGKGIRRDSPKLGE